MRSLLAIAILLLVSSASAASLPMANGYGSRDEARDIDPAGLGRLFCRGRLSGDMSALVPYLAPKLKAVFDGVLPARVPWQSRDTKPSTCRVEIVNGYSDTVGVLVKLTYGSAGGSWSDTLNLERAPGTWLLNNVFYEGGGNLRFRLFTN